MNNLQCIISAELAGHTLAGAVRALMKGISWNKAREICCSGKVRVNGELVLDAAARLKVGDQVEVNPNAPRARPDSLSRDALVYFNAQVVVVNKPAGVISVAFDKSEKNTVADRTRALLRRMNRARVGELGAVHRLDIGTTGLVVFSRTLAAKRHLKLQFRNHTIERRYLAVAHGKAAAADIESYLVENRGDGIRGSFGYFRQPRGPLPKAAQRAVTHVRPVEELCGATLVECRLETGRQHQIRIHLSERGHPLVGERIYIRDYTGPIIESPRVMLHAATLGFIHPISQELMCFEVAPPGDFTEMVKKLRKK